MYRRRAWRRTPSKSVMTINYLLWQEEREKVVSDENSSFYKINYLLENNGRVNR
jgi:hypothetical protein